MNWVYSGRYAIPTTPPHPGQNTLRLNTRRCPHRMRNLLHPSCNFIAIVHLPCFPDVVRHPTLRHSARHAVGVDMRDDLVFELATVGRHLYPSTARRTSYHNQSTLIPPSMEDFYHHVSPTEPSRAIDCTSSPPLLCPLVCDSSYQGHQHIS